MFNAKEIRARFPHITVLEYPSVDFGDGPDDGYHNIRSVSLTIGDEKYMLLFSVIAIFAGVDESKGYVGVWRDGKIHWSLQGKGDAAERNFGDGVLWGLGNPIPGGTVITLPPSCDGNTMCATPYFRDELDKMLKRPDMFCKPVKAFSTKAALDGEDVSFLYKHFPESLKTDAVV